MSHEQAIQRLFSVRGVDDPFPPQTSEQYAVKYARCSAAHLSAQDGMSECIKKQMSKQQLQPQRPPRAMYLPKSAPSVEKPFPLIWAFDAKSAVWCAAR